MKLFYTEGPIVMTCGTAGEFRLGVPREVPDNLAETLIKKGRLKEFKEDPSPASDIAAPAKRSRKEE